MRFIIRKIGLGLDALVLDGDLVVKLGGLFFCWESAEVFLFPIDHNQNLPRISIFGDAPELRAAEIVHVATLIRFLMGVNDDLKGPLVY